MTDDSDPGAAVLCARTADVGAPLLGSTRKHCARCGAEVYVSAAHTDQMTRRHGENITYICLPCGPPAGHEVTIHPVSVIELRQLGMTDDEIIVRMAACLVLGTVEEGAVRRLTEEIAAHPFGERALQVAATMVDVRKFVARVPSAN